MSWPKRDISIVNLDTVIFTGLPGPPRGWGPLNLLLSWTGLCTSSLNCLYFSTQTQLMSNSTERKARPHLTLQTAHGWEVSHALMSFHFPPGLTGNISGLPLRTDIFQVTVLEQKCTFGQTHHKSYTTILIKSHRDVSERSSYFCFVLSLHLPNVSTYMLLSVCRKYNINYCVWCNETKAWLAHVTPLWRFKSGELLSECCALSG